MPKTLERSQALIAAEIADLNALIRQSTSSNVALINQISEYIIESGGKRIRPMVLLLMFRALAQTHSKQNNKLTQASENMSSTQGAILMAAVVEFIHTSTLLHDDVVDESETRRNRQSANHIWGNAASVLVGDFLYSRSFQMMLQINNHRILKILADTTNSIAEGEVLQLLEIQNSNIAFDRYYQIIDRKTAILFASSCEIAAVLSKGSEIQVQKAKEFGHHLGVLFQIVDDTLDYFGNEQTMGKKVGDDWAERKVTLPLIYAFNSEKTNRDWFLNKFDPRKISVSDSTAINTKADLNEVIAKLRELKIDEKCQAKARETKQQAVFALEVIGVDNEFGQNLRELLDYLCDRNF